MFITGVDSYKLLHADLYPEGGMYAYFESRGGLYPETVFYGLQGKIKNYLEGTIFDNLDIKDAKIFCQEHFGRDVFPEKKWRALYNSYGGTLPILIKALPEGMVVPVHTPLFTVESTDERFGWVVPFIEDLLVWTWYPTTVATQSYYIKKELKTLREQYSDNLDGLDFMVHDFGYRGVAGEHTQAGIGGSAHLLSFKGTDTLAGIFYLEENYTDEEQYNSTPVVTMRGYSVAATEHSIMMVHDSEKAAVQRLLDVHPEGIVSCVADTTDVYAFVRMLGKDFKDQILARNGVFVVRPDSGNPEDVVLGVLEILWHHFEGTVNTKGCRVLDPHVRVIYGDGMDRETILALYKYIAEYGWAPENLTVGSGGGLLQNITRDTNRFAYKISAFTQGLSTKPVSKTPVTDRGKKSKAGKFIVTENDGVIGTQNDYLGSQPYNLLTPVFKNGELLVFQTYDEIVGRMN